VSYQFEIKGLKGKTLKPVQAHQKQPADSELASVIMADQVS
jgi:hypothetical protein